MGVSYTDCFVWTYRMQEKVLLTNGSKVTDQNVKFVVVEPPSGQTAPKQSNTPAKRGIYQMSIPSFVAG